MTRESRLSHVIGFDDAPFERSHRGDVMVIGAVFAGIRLEAILSGKVRRDGVNATSAIIDMVSRSRFLPHVQLIMTQGIALAGFNVIDIAKVHEALGVPVLAIARKQPDYGAIRRALLGRVRGGRGKWALIEKAGPMEALADVFVQRAGITKSHAEKAIRGLAVHSTIPEPLRTAHIVAGGVILGESRHRA